MSEHVHDALGAYVLGALEPDEAAAVESHLATCVPCAAEHGRLAGLPPLLALGERYAETQPPSAAVEERVLDAFAREHRRARARARARRPRRRWAFGAALAGAAAAAAIAVVLATGGGGTGGPEADWALALHGTPAAPAASARADLTSVRSGTVMRLWVRDLAPDSAYVVRCGHADAGSFRTDGHGRAAVTLTTAARADEYKWVWVLQRAGGQEQRVLGGRLA